MVWVTVMGRVPHMGIIGGRTINDGETSRGGNDNGGGASDPWPQSLDPRLGRPCPSVPRTDSVEPSRPLILTTIKPYEENIQKNISKKISMNR
ncbi:conserved hypothetical protein [Ricinus communis]|uniref:Uncharacterized protein n=1 Tax=Ricinus communis TaxID=3988 RepID=B9RJ14_RICCO|nr:conserved hypothetical protein [Ricinus communis]